MKPNNQTAAICGLFCGTCPCYPADCHGCLSDKLTPHCTICSNGFRTCAKEHAVTRCYECNEFPCNRITQFSKEHYQNDICHHENIITDLNYMREHGLENWVEKQTKNNTCKNCDTLIYWYNKKSHVCK